MRSRTSERLEAARLLSAGPWAGQPGSMTGSFQIQGPKGESLRIVTSEGHLDARYPWDHVSVSTRRRCPNWEEMCWVKELFFEDEEYVVQLHVPKSQWISNHPYCLHLWRPLDGHIKLPPGILVGKQEAGELNQRTARELYEKHKDEWL